MKSKKSLLGIVILAAIVSIGLLVFANPFKSNTQIFTESLRVLVSKSGDLTRNYQEEVGKWNMKKFDNLTMITITDRYLSQFEKLENEAKALNVPNEYENIRESFVSSVESEASSYEHFKNYLISGNKTEDQLSSDKLSLAFKQELVYADFLSKNH
ncbi:MAG TPA: hypothetical protein VK566_09355 [Nitrososphaeraceae archaeon]|nr:hypothetical protein [Nitrososphaeraceae archaeon]